MAIVTENWSDRLFAPNDSAQRGWIVTGVDNERDAINSIGAEAREKSPFLLDGSLLAEPPECRREKGPGAFHVVTRYRRDTSSAGGGSPLDLTIDWEWDEGFQSEPSDVDADGVTILNAAGFPFASKAAGEFPLNFITATRNERSFDIPLALQYRGAVNTDRVKVLGYLAEPGQLRLLSYRPTHKWNDKTTQFTNAYRVELRKGEQVIKGTQIRDGFYHRILNAGFMGWYGEQTTTTDSNGQTTTKTVVKPGRFVNAKGQPLSEPTLLGLSGKPLSLEVKVESSPRKPETPVAYQTIDLKLIEDTGDAIFLKYPKAKRLPFRALGIFR